MKRGDIYYVSLDPTFGHEQRGTRPVLIVTSESFNQLTRLPVVVPITSGGRFARIHGFAVSLASAGTKTTGVVRCDQPRVVDLEARNGRRVEKTEQIDERNVSVSVIFVFDILAWRHSSLYTLRFLPI